MNIKILTTLKTFDYLYNNIFSTNIMKPEKSVTKKINNYDDENVRYKINKNYLNNGKLSNTVKQEEDDDNIRYKLPPTLPTTYIKKTKSPDQKAKPKPKIKVNFWSNKQKSRLNNTETNKNKTNRRHTIGTVSNGPPDPVFKNTRVKVRKQVSFLPSPLFSDNHIPMVTVPDDLTIQLNEEEANDLGADLNEAFVNSNNSDQCSTSPKAKSKTTTVIRSQKRKRSIELDANVNENELEFFSKYVVQKLRKMGTNQRIYSENLINTVLMLGQLGKLNGKSKINEV